MVRKPDGAETSDLGMNPEALGQCTKCGKLYPVLKTEREELHPVGTDGSCKCGNTDFALPSEE